ncbi:MAG: HlyC/CorC family transporter [Planctomycetaceae bacterium]|nr:HlyC/CorC family transporter [Planctomycetaceae bacterium]
MSPTVLNVLAGLFLSVAFVATFVVYSLRTFSRSRLAELCRKNENDGRFGEILKEDVRVLIAWEIAQLTALAVGVAALIHGSIPAPGEVMDWVILAAGLAIGAIFILVALPWSLARVASENLLYSGWPVLLGVARLLHPAVVLVNGLDTFVHRIAGRQDPLPDNAASITEEIQSVVDEGHREGLLESRASYMIQRVMELQEEDVRAVMTPRTEMVCIQKNVSLGEARGLLLDAGHSRVPVIGDSPDDIIGILYAKDLLRYLDSNGEPAKLEDIIREPLYVPETTGIDLLMERMKRERFHLAIALDEYGGVVGLITLEDILEEIVGEIVDEFDPAEEEPIHRVDDRTTIVDARVHVDDLNEQFNFGLPEDDDFDTIGGFVFSQLGHVPDKNESLTWGPIRFTVLEADQRKIVQLRIEVDETLVSASDEQ